ncbi:MAG: shikimate dehydrogenase, partial [Deltaproteobacteria bacterium]|nr:shikimate dehydrogenase [Deltaproteobacteria bacterium]
MLLHPAGHTRSPAMHNAAFAALGVDAVYLAFDVPPADLAAAVEGARALRIRQLAVSIPHKEAIAAHLDELDDDARAIGAVNTVTRRDDRLCGANTDWLGAVRAL